MRTPASASVDGEDGLDRDFATVMGCIAHGRVHIRPAAWAWPAQADELVEWARTRRLVSVPDGFCPDALAPTSGQDGQRVQGWGCAGSINQVWNWS